MTRPPARSGDRPGRALLALVAVTGLVLTGCGTTGDAGVARPGQAAATTTPHVAETGVPDDFPLAVGLPATNGDDGSPVVVTSRPTWTEVELCGQVAWSRRGPVEATDVAGASYTGESEDVRSRLLALYDDELRAHQAFDVLREAFAGCPDSSIGGTDQVYEIVEADQGSATVTHRYRTGGSFVPGLEVIELVVVGRALYLSSTYDEGGGSEQAVGSSIGRAHLASGPAVDAMRIFS